MKRTTRKLAVRSDTVRVLAALDLARVGGGGASGPGGSGSGDDCVAVALIAENAIVAAR